MIYEIRNGQAGYLVSRHKSRKAAQTKIEKRHDQLNKGNRNHFITYLTDWHIVEVPSQKDRT